MSNYSCETRRPSASPALFLAITLLLSFTGHAAPFQTNDPEAAQKAAEAARQAEERYRAERDAAAAARERQRTDAAMRDFLKDSREAIDAANVQKERQAQVLRRAELQQFSEAFRTFEHARDQFAEVISSKTIPKDSMKKIEKSTGVFLDFIKRRSKKRASMDVREFRDYTAVELRWEMLTTAERVSPQLKALLQSENADTVDVGFLMSLSKIEEQLLRLQWMTRKVR